MDLPRIQPCSSKSSFSCENRCRSGDACSCPTRSVGTADPEARAAADLVEGVAVGAGTTAEAVVVRMATADPWCVQLFEAEDGGGRHAGYCCCLASLPCFVVEEDGTQALLPCFMVEEKGTQAAAALLRGDVAALAAFRPGGRHLMTGFVSSLS